VYHKSNGFLDGKWIDLYTVQIKNIRAKLEQPIVEDQILFVSSFEKKISVLKLAPLHVRGGGP